MPEKIALGAAAVGGFAVGSLAIGALAVGALAIGRLVIGRAEFRQLRVGRLEVEEFIGGPGTTPSVPAQAAQAAPAG